MESGSDELKGRLFALESIIQVIVATSNAPLLPTTINALRNTIVQKIEARGAESNANLDFARGLARTFDAVLGSDRKPDPAEPQSAQ
ncbi:MULTISPECIES: hypothetical protein [unclassified Chelatococcus]|uniref:hypothetical protein n=1 Tax=unclassified Chelatococcus TaxID=2638111 RepID=UPI001BCCA3C9|nr:MULTISPECIES: hypothetical protein [unclassified Chelatococcus]CAH1665577.1 hypothetical protein CHELA41_22687 [Hyphomicrobiales bacterium]MBS7737739.1 hypothetical protein [Chelatococcus sp. HY11]MBX3547228.1 hypothetical protein [Chelatococcus sp.]MCO5077133.1 hypothetical protein [Chelatococcus sp.]CAH1681248.1 hypothetical protein CHELA20_52233 [Hyphomicrobiales bacterium]